MTEKESGFVRYAEDGEAFFPYRYSDGLYRMADPAFGRERHHAKNQISVRHDQIAALLARGFSLRMRGEKSGQVNLIEPDKIERTG